jgi:hypothetical protein
MHMESRTLDALTGSERTGSVTNAESQGRKLRRGQLSGPRRGSTVQRAWKNACKNSHRLVSPSQPTGAEGLRPLDAANSALDVARIDGPEIARG